jgi:hypothetical protein
MYRKEMSLASTNAMMSSVCVALGCAALISSSLMTT